MAGRYLLVLALGAGMMFAASSSAFAERSPNGGPPVTGSMYNGNNAKPPAIADDSHAAPGASEQGSDQAMPVAGGKDGDEIAREGGG